MNNDADACAFDWRKRRMRENDEKKRNETMRRALFVAPRIA